MAFSEIELARIRKTVGALCARRNRPELKDEVTLEYRVEGHDVTVFERRRKWRGTGYVLVIDRVQNGKYDAEVRRRVFESRGRESSVLQIKYIWNF